MSHQSAAERRPLSGPAGRVVVRHRRAILRILDAQGVTNVRVFGSAARGDDGADSDIDLLVDLPPSFGLIALADLQDKLETLLGVPVDVVPDSGLKPGVRSRIASDLVPL